MQRNNQNDRKKPFFMMASNSVSNGIWYVEVDVRYENCGPNQCD